MLPDLFGRGGLLRKVTGNGEAAARGPCDVVFDALDGVHLIASHRRQDTARGGVGVLFFERGVLLGNWHLHCLLLLPRRTADAEDAVEHV